MNRRRLFQLLTGAVVGCSSLPALAGRLMSAPPLATTTLLQISPLAGFQYHQVEKLWPHLRAGQTLKLTREPANPHDCECRAY
ncbi:MAG: hypothetical protein WDZ86_07460 [Gammaproteobacteria bacterium]